MADAWTLELEDLDQLGEALPVVAPALTATIQRKFKLVSENVID